MTAFFAKPFDAEEIKYKLGRLLDRLALGPPPQRETVSWLKRLWCWLANLLP